MKLEDLLKEPELALFIENNKNVEDRVRKAAKQLANKTDAKTALVRLLPALASNEINIFFSYKQKDEDTARKIVEALEEWSSKLKITYMYDLKQKYVGELWDGKVQEGIKMANWFILLLPDPKDDWDWCLFETGLFAARATSANRLICLHHPSTEIPSPIRNYQSVKATNPDVEDFLRMVFVEDNPVPGLEPINPKKEKSLPKMAEVIVEAIRSPFNLVREIYEPWIELHVDNPGEMKSSEEFDTAIVREANPKALDLFQLLKKKRTWGDFRSNLPVVNEDLNQWREDLYEVIRKIGQGNLFYPIQAVLQSAEGKMYRPVVCAVDRVGEEGPIETFHITFAEDVSTVDRSVMPKNLSVLANILRSAFRFRWEVLEKFGKGTMEDGDIERLESAFDRIKKDWESRNLGGEKEIIEIFPRKDEQNKLQDMFIAWSKIKNVEKNGELDIAIENRDVEKIPGILSEFLPLNQDFLEMAADRFACIIAGKYPTG